MRWNDTLRIVAVLFGLLLAPSGLLAAEAEGDKPVVDPKAEKALKALAKSLGGKKALEVKIATDMTLKRGEQERQHESTYVLAQERPNRVLLISKDKGQAFTLVSDGKQMTIYSAKDNRYTQHDAEKTLAGIYASKTGQQMLAIFGGPTFLPKMLAGEPYEKAISDAQKIEYVGQETADKAKLHHLKITQEKMDWELWLTAGKEPMPVKIRSDLAKMLGKRGGGEAPQMTLEVTYADWKTSDKLPTKTFAFKPPADAEEFDPSAGRDQDHGGHPLVGKPAPDFEIPTLDGKTFKLSDHQGKNVVVLDFWATWCGPCVRALPILVEVTDAYAKKGVVFCAVNLREGKSKIKRFLEKQELDCLVGMDKDGSVASSYKVEGIPQSVIVGKDGKVAKVHVGFNPELKSQLKSELDELVGGQ